MDTSPPPSTPSPTDPPKGREVLNWRRREHNGKHFPRMLALWRRGSTHREIAEELNKGSRNCYGRPWTSHAVQNTLVNRTDPAEYAALARAGMSRAAARGNATRTTTHDQRALPRVVELMKAGRTQRQVAAQLNAEGYSNGTGSPWTQSKVSALLHRRLPPAGRAALMPGGKTRGPAARRRAAAESEGAIAPRVVEMWRSGLSLSQIAARLKEEGVSNNLGRAWSRNRLSAILRAHMDPAAHAARLARGYRGGATIRWRGTRQHDAAMLPRILELRREGLSLRRIAERLNEEAGQDVARLNGAGHPWNSGQVQKVLRRSHGGSAPGHRHGRRAAAVARSTTPPEDATPEAGRLGFEDLIKLGASHLVPPIVLGVPGPPLTEKAFLVYQALLAAGPEGHTEAALIKESRCGGVRWILEGAIEKNPRLELVTLFPGRGKRKIKLGLRDDFSHERIAT